MNIMNILQKWRFDLIAITFFIWGTYYRAKTMLGRDLSPDELNQLKHTVGPIRSLFDRSYNGELTAFPGDYYLKWPFVRLFGENNLILIHIPHYIATALCFWLLYKICRRHIKSTVAFTIPFIFTAFNYNLLYHSFEFRPYAVLPAMALAIFYLTDLLIIEFKNKSSVFKYITGILFLYFTIYHAYMLMIILLSACFFIIKNKEHQKISSTLKEISVFYIPFLLIAIPIFTYYAMGIPWFNKEHTAERNINTFDYIPDPRENPNTFFRTMLGNLLGFKMFKLKHLVWGITLSVFIPNKQKVNQIAFLMLIIVIPICAILFSDIQKGYWFVQRQFVWAMPLFAFLMGWCWDSIISWVNTRPWVKNT